MDGEEWEEGGGSGRRGGAGKEGGESEGGAVALRRGAHRMGFP